MLEHLPPGFAEGQERLQARAARRRPRLRVQVGDAVFPIRRLWAQGFALEADLSPRLLRGLVDIHEGPRHIFQCLIVASEIEGDDLICTFKRMTPVADRAALDYERDANAPVAYLPRA
jgi:hypothetical protein